MEIAITWLPIVGPVLIGIAFAIFYGMGGHRTFAIWAGFVGGVLLLLGFALHIQNSVWKEKVPDPSAAIPSDQRPWLKIDSYSVDFLKIEPVYINVGITLNLKNVGKGPAMGVESAIEAHPLTQELFQNIDAKHKEICERAKRMHPSRRTATTLFPGDKPFSVNFSAAVDTKTVNPSIPAFKNGASFVVLGCFDYLLNSGDAHGQTGFRFSIARRSPNNLPYAIKVQDGIIEGGELLMSEDPYGNYAQ